MRKRRAIFYNTREADKGEFTRSYKIRLYFAEDLRNMGMATSRTSISVFSREYVQLVNEIVDQLWDNNRKLFLDIKSCVSGDLQPETAYIMKLFPGYAKLHPKSMGRIFSRYIQGGKSIHPFFTVASVIDSAVYDGYNMILAMDAKGDTRRADLIKEKNKLRQEIASVKRSAEISQKQGRNNFDDDSAISLRMKRREIAKVSHKLQSLRDIEKPSLKSVKFNVQRQKFFHISECDVQDFDIYFAVSTASANAQKFIFPDKTSKGKKFNSEFVAASKLHHRLVERAAVSLLNRTQYKYQNAISRLCNYVGMPELTDKDIVAIDRIYQSFSKESNLEYKRLEQVSGIDLDMDFDPVHKRLVNWLKSELVRIHDEIRSWHKRDKVTLVKEAINGATEILQGEDGNYYAKLTFNFYPERKRAEDPAKSIGVDMGMSNLAAFSDGRIDSPDNGKVIDAICHKKNCRGDKWSKGGQRKGHKRYCNGRTELSKREAGLRIHERNIIARMAKNVTSVAINRELDYIAIENLEQMKPRATKAKNARFGRRKKYGNGAANRQHLAQVANKQMRRKLSAWHLGHFQDRMTEASRFSPVRVAKMSPAFTSQKCSSCGNVDSRARVSRDVYSCTNKDCRKHGVPVCADVNAAKNVRKSLIFVKSENIANKRDTVLV